MSDWQACGIYAALCAILARLNTGLVGLGFQVLAVLCAVGTVAMIVGEWRRERR